MFINLNFLIWIFEKLQNTEIAKMLRELEAKVNKLSSDNWQQYYETYFAAFDNIVQSFQETGVLTEEYIKKIASFKLKAEEILKEKFSIEVGTVFGVEYTNLKALHYLGVLTWYESEGKLTFFYSPTLTISMIGYVSNMDENSLRNHIKSIEMIRRGEFTEEDIDAVSTQAIDYVNSFMSVFRSFLAEHAKTILNPKISTKELESIASIELLPTSTNFYQAGIKYYQSKFGVKVPTHFTFATTSGIIIPQEHYGYRYFTEILPIPQLANSVSKNPIRERYFDVVREAQARKPRAYYFEFKRTATTLKETYGQIKEIDSAKADTYLEHAIKILESYLQLPNFSLIKIDKFPNEFNYLTLGNSANILLSIRDKTKKIAHGMWLKPKRTLLSQALKDVKWKKEIILPLIGTALGSAIISGALLENLLVAFTAAFAPLVYFGVSQIRGTKNARDAIFDIAERIKKRKLSVEIVKDFNKKPYIHAGKLIERLLD